MRRGEWNEKSESQKTAFEVVSAETVIEQQWSTQQQLLTSQQDFFVKTSQMSSMPQKWLFLHYSEQP